MSKFDRAALLIIDVQKAIDADYHAVDGPRNNPHAEQRIAARFPRRLRTADEVHSVSLANPSSEYCVVVDTAAVLAG